MGCGPYVPAAALEARSLETHRIALPTPGDPVESRKRNSSMSEHGDHKPIEAIHSGSHAKASVASGHKLAFDEFFACRYQTMVNLASGLVDNRPTAEEIVQDSFQRVWLRWGDLDQPAQYLRTTVVNSCNDELRKRRVRRNASRMLGSRPEPERHYLVDLLAAVQPRRREALVLRFYGGHTVSEVAQVMDIPQGTAKSLIHRGLADLRGALAPVA
jgi:RNA polymerase sigma factor (sigma-70 family)